MVGVTPKVPMVEATFGGKHHQNRKYEQKPESDQAEVQWQETAVEKGGHEERPEQMGVALQDQ